MYEIRRRVNAKKQHMTTRAKSNSSLKNSRPNRAVAETPLNLDGKLALTSQELSRAIGVSVRTLFQWRKEGILNPIIHRQTVIYPIAEVQRFLATRSSR